MPFPSALTSQQKTDLRATGYKGNAYVLATPKDIVFQALVGTAISDSDYAEVEYGTPSTGAFGDIVAGQTVIIHTDANDIDDVVSDEYPTFAREAATASVVKIGWKSTDITTSDTITVLNDYRLNVRQVRALEASGTVFLDYDNTWTPLPPAIYGLQSVYAVNSSTASSLSFAPTVEAMASGASISTYLWDVGDGTITTGTTATKDITVSFPAWSSGATDGWRWVSLTATDDNSTSTTFHFQVFVGDFNSAAWVVQDVDLIDISSNQNEGFIASLTVGNSSANFYNDQHITIVIDETKNGDSDAIVSNIAFVGRLKGKVDEVTAQIIQELSAVQIDNSTSYELQGYGVELSLLPLPEYQLIYSAAASDWNEVTQLTIARAIWYALVQLTTAPTIMAFDLDTATWNDYKNIGFSLEQGTVLESVNRLALKVGANLIFARSGECALVKDARLQSSADRDTLTTITDITSDDMRTSASVRIPSQRRVGRVEVTGGSIDTSITPIDKAAVYLRATSPKVPNTLGESVRQYDILLASDPADTASLNSEIAVLAGNFLARNNEPIEFDCDLHDGYWFLIAHNEQWYTITYSDFQSGVSYDTNTRWILQDHSLSIQAITTESGIPYQDWSIQATFSIETTSQGIANSIVYAPRVQPYDIPQVSVMAPYGSNYTPENAYDEAGGGFGANGDTGEGEGLQPVQPPSAPPTPTPQKDCIVVPLSGDAAIMNKTTINGNVYKVTVTGRGITALATGSSDTVTFDPGGYTNYSITGGSEAAFGNPGDCVYYNDTITILATAGASVRINFDSTTTINSISFDAYAVREGSVGGTSWVVKGFNSLGVLQGTVSSVIDEVDEGSWQSITANFGGINCDYITVAVQTTAGASPVDFEARIDNIEIPSNDTGENLETDAFYEFDSTTNTATGASKGLRYNGSVINGSLVSPPYYNTSHLYEFTITGTGDTENFDYLDTDYTENSGQLTVCVEGEFA